VNHLVEINAAGFFVVESDENLEAVKMLYLIYVDTVVHIVLCLQYTVCRESSAMTA